MYFIETNDLMFSFFFFLGEGGDVCMFVCVMRGKVVKNITILFFRSKLFFSFSSPGFNVILIFSTLKSNTSANFQLIKGLF